MAYVDLATLQTIATGQPFAAATLQQARDNDEFFIDPPACSVYNSAAVSLPNNALTTLNANSENYDNDSMHSTTVNTSRVTIQTAGRYLIYAKANFASNGVGGRLVGVLRNGVTVDDIQVAPAPSGNTGMIYITSLALAVGDYVEARVRQVSGGALDVTLVEFSALFLTR